MNEIIIRLVQFETTIENIPLADKDHMQDIKHLVKSMIALVH
jgi:hypothetical protein